METLSTKPIKGNLECHKRERVIQFHSQFDKCVFGSVDDVPHNISKSAHPTQLYMFEDDAAVIQMINKGRSPNLKHVTRTHRVQLDCLFERIIMDHFLIQYIRTHDQLADILTMRMSTTIQWHSLLTLWQIRRPYESDDVRSFSRKHFSSSTLAKHQAMFQVTTQNENVDKMWRGVHSPVPAVSTRSHSRCSRTCRSDMTRLIMEGHDGADSDTGRDECRLRQKRSQTQDSAGQPRGKNS